MLKLTKTGIGLLTKQYRSVLRKCLLLNLGILPFSIFQISKAEPIYCDYVSAPWFQDSRGNNVAYDCYFKDYHGFGEYLTFYSVAGVKYTGYFTQISGSDENAGYYRDSESLDSFLPRSTIFSLLQQRDIAIANRITLEEVQNIQSLNYYYTFRGDERVEAIDYTSFFQKDFLTLQKVDLHIKNPTNLGAFAKCDEVCPRPSERFSLSLSQEQMFRNDASVDAGTSRYCLRQFGDVVADLLKNTAAKSLRISEFMNEEVRHA